MPQVLIDNDVLAKCAIYSLTNEMVAAFGISASEIGVLGSVRFVISAKRLKTAGDGGAKAHRRLIDFLRKIHLLEPNLKETALAVELERLAIKLDVQLDVGESQLCAIAIARAAKWMCTGDKRAIMAVERLRGSFPALSDLDHKLVCLEALIKALIKIHGHTAIRSSICANRGTDKALEICFQCHNAIAQSSEIDQGIESYLNTILNIAPRVSTII